MEISTVLSTGADSLIRPDRPKVAALCRELAGEEDWRQAMALRRNVAHEEGNDSDAHTEFILAHMAEARRLAESGCSARFGAFVEGRLRSGLGIVLGGNGQARYQTVETHPRWRGQGLAGTLVYEACVWADHNGARSIVIVADPGGAAVRIYRSLGFAVREQQVALWRPAAEGR